MLAKYLEIEIVYSDDTAPTSNGMTDPRPAEWQAAVDIGGTFTDLLLVHSPSGRHSVGKVLTDHASPARGVVVGLEALLDAAALEGEDIGNVIHATTLVTNAVIERKGASTALLMTEGFRDTLIIGREHRYDMYDVLLEKPEPLVPRRLTFGVPERTLADGTVLTPLDEAAVRTTARELLRLGVRALAVCLLHAYRFSEHEARVRAIVHDEAPDLLVSLSHEVVGEQREYERALTTAVNAYVLEIVDRYLAELEDQLTRLGYRGDFLVMLSSGATATTDTARAFPVRLIESGPAAGALGAAHASRLIGRPNLMSFDMGGTTAKACLINDGRPTISSEMEVARRERFKRGSGLPLKISSVELIEIGAGGGSIARLDRFGLLQVGPDSAGSEPGPACYGRGGTEPTVTDADLILGYLDPRYFLGGRMQLDLNLAREAVHKVADPLGVDIARAAWVIHQVVNETMANAARIHAAEQGRSIDGIPLFAFGGAGPVHAYRVAVSLGMPIVIAPLGAGVGSTIGLLAAPLAFDFVRTAVDRVADLDWSVASGLIAGMEDAGRDLLVHAGVRRDQIRIERSADMRLVGQAQEISVQLPGPTPGPGAEGALEEAFFSAYSALFGRTPPNVSVEVVNWRVRVFGPEPSFRLQHSGRVGLADAAVAADAGRKGGRMAYFPEAGGYEETPVYDRYLLVPTQQIEGPAIIEERESTLVIGPGSHARVDEFDNVIVELPS